MQDTFFPAFENDQIEVPKLVEQRAQEFVDTYLLCSSGWPFDHWIALTHEFDLHLWYDVLDEHAIADVYPTGSQDHKNIFNQPIKVAKERHHG